MPTFDERETAFLVALGHAITQWTHVEDALFRIFAAALKAKHDDRAAAVFYSQMNFRAKLDLTDAVLIEILETDSPTLAEWGRLFRRLKKKSTKRNMLAHNEYMLVATPRPDSKVSELIPTMKPRSNKPSNRLAYVFGTEDLDDGAIRRITGEFNEMRAALEAYLKTLP